MPHDVFISHSSLDRDAAYALCDSLEAAQVPCWIAPRDIPAGSDWQGEIMEAISGTKMMLVLFSQNGNASANVSKEVTAAAEVRVPIIPVRLDDTPPSATLRYHLSGVHWLDAYPPPLDGHLSRIADLVRGRVARMAAAATPRPAPAPAPHQTAVSQPRPVAPTPPPSAAPPAASDRSGPFAGAAPARAPEPVARQTQGLAGLGASNAGDQGYLPAGGGTAAATGAFAPFEPSAPAPKSSRGQWLLIGGILGGLVLVAILLLVFANPQNSTRPPPGTGGQNGQVNTPPPQTGPPPDAEVTDPGQTPPTSSANPSGAPGGGSSELTTQETQLTALFQQVRGQQEDPSQIDETEQQFQTDRTACGSDAGCLTRLYADRRSVLEGWGNTASADNSEQPAAAE